MKRFTVTQAVRIESTGRNKKKLTARESSLTPPPHPSLSPNPSLLRVLLRVRMLYYLKVEVLGEAANQALEGIPARYGACSSRCGLVGWFDDLTLSADA